MVFLTLIFPVFLSIPINKMLTEYDYAMQQKNGDRLLKGNYVEGISVFVVPVFVQISIKPSVTALAFIYTSQNLQLPQQMIKSTLYHLIC